MLWHLGILISMGAHVCLGTTISKDDFVRFKIREPAFTIRSETTEVRMMIVTFSKFPQTHAVSQIKSEFSCVAKCHQDSQCKAVELVRDEQDGSVISCRFGNIERHLPRHRDTSAPYITVYSIHGNGPNGPLKL